MISQSKHFHETWAHARDNAKPTSLQDLDDLRKLRRSQPPSEEHIATLKRSHRGHDKSRRPYPPAKPDTPEEAGARKSRLQWAEYQRLQRLRDPKPAPSPLPPHMSKTGFMYVEPKRDTALDVEETWKYRFAKEANDLRDFFRDYYGPMTRREQAAYAFVCGRPDVIYVNSAGEQVDYIP